MEEEIYRSDIETVYNRYFYPITVQLKTTVWLNEDGTINKCEACFVTDDSDIKVFKTESEAVEWAQKENCTCWN